jgi:hypothetical protein
MPIQLSGAGNTRRSTGIDVLRGISGNIGQPTSPSSGTPWAPPSPVPLPQAPSPAPIQQNFTQGVGVTPFTQPYNGGGGGAIGGGDMGGGGGGSAMSAPARPMQYSEFTDDQAATDSTFMDQKSAYSNALKKFIEDNDRQGKILDADAGTAKQGIARNRTAGLTSLGEDFASRGMTNSGLYANEQTKASQQYQKQDDQVTTGLKNGKDDLGFRRAKYEAENGENGTNIQAARREAFARLAASQGLT